MITPEEWVGVAVVSQYGLPCDVLAAWAEDAEKQTVLRCQARHNSVLWEWWAADVALITRDGELLDWDLGEVWGRLDDDGQPNVFYEGEDCRLLTTAEVVSEFHKARTAAS